jgi:hypothetical protein
MLAPDTFEGTPCLRVAGHLKGDDVEIWIGRDDLLIRRIVTTHRDASIPDLVKDEEIRRDIQVDRDLPDDTFDVTPPAPGADRASP